MAGTNEKILETISNMTVMEVVDLISEMEEKFGVKAAAAVAAAPAAAAAGGEAAAEEKSEFNISLESFGGNKVAVINTKDWYLSREIFQIKKPSGIFIYEGTK